MEAASARLRLGHADTLLTMKNLPLQIAEFDVIVIRQNDVADTGRRQVQGGGRSQAARPHDQHLCGGYAFLPFDAELVQQDMTRVTKKLLVVHAAWKIGRA